MAISDDQLHQLLLWAEQLGKDGVLNDPSDHEIVSAVFDMAETHNMRTEDEFNAIVTIDDLPAPEDHDEIVKAWAYGNRLADEVEEARLAAEGMDVYGSLDNAEIGGGLDAYFEED